MNRKSKFLTFILSFIPGLGHIYLGVIQRGMVFFLATVFIVIGGVFFGFLGIFYDPLPFIFLPFVWLASLVDALILADRINRELAHRETAEGEGRELNWEEELKIQNSKILAIAFSIIPGAGHMFCGQMNKGIQLMAAFFLTLYLSDFLNMTLLLMFAPIIWFYSVFDIMHRVANREKLQNREGNGEWLLDGLSKESGLSNRASKYLGLGLIIIGIFILLNRIVLPQLSILLDPRFIEYLRTGFIALLFIAGGIKLLLGSKEKAENSIEEE